MTLEGWGALVLAAGAGRRFGGGKLLALLGGVPVIRRTLDMVLTVGFGEVVVAVGADHEAVAGAVQGLPCQIVSTPDWEDGMAASLHTGLAALGEPGKGLFVFLGDMPLVPVHLCPALASMAEEAGYAARPRVGGRPGHPVAFAPAALPDLARLTGDQGATGLLNRRSAGVAYLDTDAMGAVLDIDNRSDLSAAERAWKAHATCATSDSAMSRGALPKP